VNAFSVVEQFERAIAEYAGARHGIAVDCCTSAIFLSCKYRKIDTVVMPCRTYISVAAAVVHAGGRLSFSDTKWSGIYPLRPYEIYDGAKRFKRDMYAGGLHCLSFHAKKHIPIGRGGMILTDDDQAQRWLTKARYDGREGKAYDQEKIDMLGWHLYMTPEQAARGLQLFEAREKDSFEDLNEDYPDLREMPVFREHRLTEAA
jgi:dTDP-4-amino-4,6-dideoxygalactose transaminase